jgi:tetratricopeptide (TPR) repeat protein
MRFTTISLILLSLLALPNSTAVAQDKPTLTGIKACNQALKLLQEGKPADALEVMTAAKGTLDAEDEWLWWGNTGHCYRDLRKDADALTHYGKAVELQPDCWFRFSYCLLLHEFGRWDDAVKELDKKIDPDYADYVASLKEVIAGPFKERWPLTWPKLEYRSKRGNYHIVSDVGVTVDDMDALEAEATKLDLTKKPDQGRLEKMLKPHNDLVSLANLAELARDEFIRFCGVSSRDMPKGKVSKVFFFVNEQDYHNFAARCGGGDTTNALGFFSPAMKYLQLYSQPGAESKVCGLALDTIDTFFHEGWHQFFDQLSEQRPIWLNEGLAEFLGYASVKDKGAKIELGLLIRARGKNYTRYEINKELVKQSAYIPFTDFFKYTPRDWHANDSDVCYSQAWSIAYFALKGSDANFKKDYASLFRELLRGRPNDEVVDEIFGDEKLKKYEDAWKKYWLNI